MTVSFDIVVERSKTIKQGNPLDPETQVGAQASKEQFDKIMSYMEIGRQEGAQILIGGDSANLSGDLSGGYYVQPTPDGGQERHAHFPRRRSLGRRWV